MNTQENIAEPLIPFDGDGPSAKTERDLIVESYLHQLTCIMAQMIDQGFLSHHAG